MTDQQQGETPQYDPNAPAADSQQEANQDSGLQTPQADQQVPPVNNDGVDGSQDAPPTEAAVSAPPSSADQVAAEEQRQAERDAQVQEHNARTGGGAVQEGEVQAQRDEHNARVSGEAQVDDSQDQA